MVGAAFAFGVWLLSTRREGSGGSATSDQTALATATPGVPTPAPGNEVAKVAPSAELPAPQSVDPVSGSGGGPVSAAPSIATRLPVSGAAAGTAPQLPMREASGSSAAAVPAGKVDEVGADAVAIDLDKVTLSLRDFRTIAGENPIGTNAEITAALNGGNRRQSRLVPEGVSVNGKGEMVDRWGMPYFFHQLSRTEMEIRSAGPDRVLWTTDDIISH